MKALRHYDEIGLLTPARVDSSNGHRYYDPTQVETAVTIRRVRALEPPLDEIARLLEEDGEAARERLAAHGYRVAEELRDKNSLLIELSALVEGGGEAVAMEVRDAPELRLAATTRHLRFPVDPEGLTEMIRFAWKRLDERGIAPAGPPTAIFRGGDGNGTHLGEVGLPVAAGIEGDELLPIRVYPVSIAAATFDHYGSYEGLHTTAQRFISTVLGQGLRFSHPLRVEYIELDVHARLVWPLAAN